MAPAESWEIHSFLNKFMQLTSCGISAALNLNFDGEIMNLNLQTSLKCPNLPSFQRPDKRTKPSRIRRRNRRKKAREWTCTSKSSNTCTSNTLDSTSSSNENENNENPSTAITEVQSLTLQEPINCIRHVDGCENIIHSYFNKYTAICDSCILLMDQKQKSSPYSQYICPCCHQPNSGVPYSLCAECLADTYEDGWVETGRGAWHLDRDRDRIVCIYLDFNQPMV